MADEKNLATTNEKTAEDDSSKHSPSVHHLDTVGNNTQFLVGFAEGCIED